MAVTSSPSNTYKNKFLGTITKTYSSYSFVEADKFYWSPKKQTIYYDTTGLQHPKGQWALLHELSHALLDHNDYKNDLALLQHELAAWEKAKLLADGHGLKIDQDHIEDCLDTYRDWLYARSTCTVCRLNSLQISANTYKCLNCQSTWRVSASRFCRPYRMQN